MNIEAFILIINYPQKCPILFLWHTQYMLSLFWVVKTRKMFFLLIYNSFRGLSFLTRSRSNCHPLQRVSKGLQKERKLAWIVGQNEHFYRSMKKNRPGFTCTRVHRVETRTCKTKKKTNQQKPSLYTYPFKKETTAEVILWCRFWFVVNKQKLLHCIRAHIYSSLSHGGYHHFFFLFY